MATASPSVRPGPSSSSRRPSGGGPLQSQSSQSSQSSQRSRGIISLPPYEAQIAELNPNAKRAVQALGNSTSSRRLRTHLGHVGKALTENAGHINDRLTDARERYEKQKRKRREKREALAAESGEGNGEGGAESGDEDEEGRKRIEELEKRVNEATEEMEEKMRGVVDSEGRIDTLMTLLGKMGQEEGPVQGSGNVRITRRRGRREDEDEADNEDDEDEAQGENRDDEQVVPANRALDTELAEKKSHWDALSLTERYSTNNTYIGFYRMVHESKHPGNNIPPLPPASTWFSDREEQPADEEVTHTPWRANKRKQVKQQPEEEEEAGDDVAIHSERISLNCPITFLRFKDPVTSTKCPHSFEREAIEAMIRRGTGGGGRRNAGGRGRVQCPVCTKLLTLQDLRPDPVLVRRVRRANEMDAREDEDGGEDGDEDEEDVMLESARRRKKRSLAIKTEKSRSPTRERSVVPDTQFDAVSDDEDGDEDGNSAPSEMEVDEQESGGDDAS